MPARRHDATIIWTQILPVLFFVFLMVAERMTSLIVPGLTSSEFGIVETLQVGLLFMTILQTGVILYQGGLNSKWLKAWVIIGLVGALYVFLEETSYGQNYFGWDTPPEFSAINDQDETNWHNTSSWLDQKPRLLLEIGVIIGGLIVPILKRFKPHLLPTRFEAIYPDSRLFIVAFFAIVPRLYERLLAPLGVGVEWYPFERTSEVQEAFFYYFILLYFLFFRTRLKNT